MIYHFYIKDNVIYYTTNVEDIPENIEYTTMDIDVDPTNVTYMDNQFTVYNENYILNQEKRNKVNLLKDNFDIFTDDGFMYSQTLSCFINFGSLHLRNVDSLISLMESANMSNVLFRIYDNSFKQVSLEQLKIVKLELIQFGLKLYQIKWQLENLINQCQTTEDLDSIVVDFVDIINNGLYGINT